MPMQAHDPQRSHHDDAVEIAPTHAPEPAVEAQPAGRQVPPAADFAKPTGRPAVASSDAAGS